MRRLLSKVAAVVGSDELMLLVGLGLMTVGLWPCLGLVSLVVPGAALTWIAMPTRRRFIDVPAPQARRGR